MPKKPEKKKPAAAGKKSPRYPSREKLKSVSVPKDYWERLDAITKQDPRYDERKVAFMVRLAIREWLERYTPPQPKPE